MVHWLADTMPLKASGPRCAVLMRAGTTQWSDHCSGLPVVEARWRFVDRVTRLRWCADHADVLTRRDRCVEVRPLQLAGRRWEVAHAED